jgi:hypothetical protein
MISAEYHFPNEENDDFLELFLTSAKEMNELIATKNEIMQKVPRVGKTGLSQMLYKKQKTQPFAIQVYKFKPQQKKKPRKEAKKGTAKEG